jgi:chemotaxis protein CheC
MKATSFSGDAELAVLEQLFGAATHDASAAMCRWTNGCVTLSLDEIRELPLDIACAELLAGDELLTMVVLSVEGEIGGQMILTFDEAHGRRLVASLLGRPVPESPQWSELEKSALTETGNILGCAYVNALTRLLGIELIPSAPYFIQDYGASVLQQALLAQAIASDKILTCRTCFRRQGEEPDWHVLFIPTLALRRAMAGALFCTS